MNETFEKTGLKMTIENERQKNMEPKEVREEFESEERRAKRCPVCSPTMFFQRS